VPGLGQAAVGAIARGLIIALPALLLVAFVAGIWLVDRGLIIEAALTPAILLAMVGLSLVVMVYRLWAIVDAYRLARPLRRGRSRGRVLVSAGVLAVVVAATIGMHGWVAYVGWTAHQALTAVFSPTGPTGGGQGPLPSESPSPTASPTDTAAAETATPVPTPVPTPTPTPQPDWAADGRLNVLFIGSDAGPGRWSMRADAIILVSVEIETGRVAAFSIPRYTTNVPLPEPAASAFACRCLTEPINALYVFANQNPELFPGDEIRGFVALEGAIEILAGVELDGVAAVDMNGFVRLVDAIGGVTVDVPYAVYDPAYPDPDGVTEVEIYFAPGVQVMNGWQALAYSRTRHQDGDVMRMQRQQHVMKALQRQLGCDLLPNLPSVLEVVRDTVWTSLRLEDVPGMLRIDPGPVEAHSLFDIHNPALTDADIERIRDEVAGAFDGPPPPDDEPEPEC
jgi:LCP family protein required for cell wall assembly